MLKGLFHTASLARAVSWFAFVVAIIMFMAHESRETTKANQSRHVQGMLDGADVCKFNKVKSICK